MKLTRAPVKGTDHTLNDLIEGDEFEFRIVAVNEAGQSKPSAATNSVKIKNPVDKPSAPGMPDIVSIDKDSATLRWSRPTTDGGAPVTNYRIEMKTVGSYRWDLANPNETVTDTRHTLRGLQPETDYEFRVIAENRAGVSQPSTESRTAKYVQPVQFTRPLADVKVAKLGEPATFQCEITKPGARAQWLKDGFDLHHGPKYDIGVTDRNYRLTIRDVDDRDAGDYAIVVHGHRSEARLHVEAKPEFKISDKFLEPLVLKAGTSATVEVPFSGSPQPKLTWRANGVHLHETRRVHVETIYNQTTLVISRAERSDAGTYSLSLENQFGTSTLSVKVIVLDKPSVPRDLRATNVTEDSVTLNWLPPQDNGGAEVTHYTIEKREALRMTWHNVGTTVDTSMVVPRLTEGVQYVFRVSAVNKVGTGPPEELNKAVSAKSPHYVPMPPSGIQVSDIYKDSCIVSWSPPTGDGGSPITGYNLEQRLLVRPTWLKVNTSLISGLNYHVTGLSEGQSYQYRVIAENRVGHSEPSMPSATVIAKDPWEKPSAPGIPKVSDVTRRSCKLSWLPPTSDGGDDIRSYIIEYRFTGAFKWVRANEGERTPETFYRVSGLQADTDYEFRVAAENRAGVGPYSEGSMAIKALDIAVGKEPAILSSMHDVSTNVGKSVKLECDISLGKPKAEIRWFRDAREIYKSSKYRITNDDNVATLTISNVEPLDAGLYRCELYNQHGRVETNAKLIINAAPVIDIEHRYKLPQEVKRGATLILPVNFTATPKPRVTWYRNNVPLTARPGHVLIDTGDQYSTLTVLGIEGEEGGRYEIKVENLAGLARQEFNVIVKSVPQPPSSLRVTGIQKDAVSLSWEEPENDGGMPLTGYVIERSDASRGGWVTVGQVDPHTRSYRIPKLLEGSRYYFRILAENSVGASSPIETSQAVEVKSPYDTPEAPRNVEISEASRTGIVLQWQPPRGDGGAPVRGYIIERSVGLGGRYQRLTRGPIIDTYYRDVNVHEGCEYDYRVAAENEAGEGIFSKSVGPVAAKVPYDKPWPPGKPTVTAMTRNSVALSWLPPRNDGGSPITNYIVESKSSSYYAWTSCSVGQKVSEPRFTVPNLSEGTSYEFRVIAENVSGRSEPSPSSTPVVIRDLMGGRGPTIQEHMHDSYARLGGVAEFYCRVASETSPKIAWTKDYASLPEGRKYTMKYHDNLASLSVHDVSDADRGLYTCEISNIHGYSSSSAALRLKEPPKIDIDPRLRNLSAHVGGAAKISVGVEGEPAPTVTWYKDGLQIKGRANVGVETSEFLSTINIRRLTREDEGEYEIVAKNEWGTTRERFHLKVMDVPQAPQNIRTTEVRETSIQLDWSKPRFDGGSSIISYIVEKRESSSNYWSPAGTVEGSRTSLNVTGLRPGAEYQLRVFAENEMGVSEPCTLTMPVRMLGGQVFPESFLPSLPSVRHSDLLEDRVTLEWEPVVFEPRYHLKSYVVERFQDPPPRWDRLIALPPTVTRYTVAGLRADQRHRFRIFGESVEGPTSKPYEYETPAFIMQPGDVPYRPVGPMIVTKLSPHSLEIEWRPPIHDGGHPIQGYVVEMSESGGPWKKVGYTNSRDNKFIIAGLTEGSNYFFRVLAENSSGLSKPLQSDVVVPSAPAGGVLTGPSSVRYGKVRKDSVTVEWDLPEREDTSITGYLIEKKDVRREHWAPVHKVAPRVRTYDVPGLVSGHEYMFRVRSLSRLGTGEPVEIPTPVTMSSQYNVPSPPRGPISRFKVTSDSVELRWMPPDTTGNLPLLSYIVEVKEAARAYWKRSATLSGAQNSYTLTGLSEGVEYVVRIIARNQEGESQPLVSETFTLPKAKAVPSAPSMLRVERVTGDSVTLNWSHPYSDGGAEITKYVILKRLVDQRGGLEAWDEVARVSGTTTTYTVSRLREGKGHLFAVYAISRVGEGDQMETARPVYPRRAATRPVPPVGPLAIHAFSHDSVTLSWAHPPGSEGLISSYRIEKKEVSRIAWDVAGTVDASETTYTVRGLKAGTDYYFRVIAENGAGASAPLTLDRAFIPRMPYNKPASPLGPLEVSNLTKDSLTLSWLPPPSDGGAAVSAYIIERKDKKSTAWTKLARVKGHITTYTVSNLIDSSQYLFRVLAENSEGLSAPLTLDRPVQPRRPTGKPSPPSGLLRARKLKSDTILLEWNAPVDDGGSRITSYVVEYRDVDSLIWQRAATVEAYSRSCSVEGLREGKEYMFRVHAVNEFGRSEWLEMDVTLMRSARQLEAPAAPRGPLIVGDVHKNSMTLSWQPPYSEGDSPVTGYIIEKQDTSLGLTSSWTRVDKVRSHIYSLTVTHLAEGHRYLFRIIAENSSGRSSALESRIAVEARSPYEIPGAPTSIRLIGISEDSLTIEWTPPTSDGGRPIIRYVIEKRDAHSQIWSQVATVGARATVYQVTGLHATGSYFLRVAAENDEGIGFYREFIEPVKPIKPKSLPMAPTGLRSESVTRDSITLRWDAPLDTGGVPLSGYIIEQQDGKSTTGRWRMAAYVDSTKTSWTLNNLIQGYEYSFRVRAENPEGAGPACTLSTSVIPKPVTAKPSAPVLLEVVGLTEDSVTLSWLSPERDGGARVQGYVIERRELGRHEGWQRVKRIDSSEILVACIEGLREGCSYLFRVYAENDVGAGPSVELREPLTPRSQLGPPSAPEGGIRILRVTRNMLAIHWSPPVDTGGYPVERYIIEKREADHSYWTQAGVCPPDVTAFCITDLLEDQMYYFRVVAETAYGFSEPLECDKPVVPRRVFESAPMMEIESWMRVDPTAETSHSTRRITETTRRTYSAYSDEPLTTTHDTLSGWLRRY